MVFEGSQKQTGASSRSRLCRFTAALLLFSATLVVGACGETASETESGGGSASEGPVKVGVMLPQTGPQALLGEELKAGFELYAAQNPEAGGRKVELVFEDTASNPQTGLTKARKLVQQDRVAAVGGVVNSAVLAAVGKVITDQEVPLVVTNAGSNDFTMGEDVSPYAFRVSTTNSQVNRPLGWYAHEKLGVNRAAIVTYDFIAGEEEAEAFKEVFTGQGGTIAKETKVALGTSDFGPVLSGIPRNVDAVYVFLAGSEAVNFWKQAGAFGLTDDVKIIGPGFTLDDIVAGAVGKAATGFVGSIQYVNTVDLPRNDEFVAAFEERFDRQPSVYAEDAYTGAEAIWRALDAVKGDTRDKAAFAKALSEVTFESPRGPFKFGENGQAEFTVYFYEASMKGGKLAFEVIDTIPNVGPLWEP